MNKFINTKIKSASFKQKFLPNLMAGITLFTLSIFVMSGTLFGTQVSAEDTVSSPTRPTDTVSSPTTRREDTVSTPTSRPGSSGPTSGGLVTLRSPLKKVSVDELLDLAVKLAVRIGTVLSVLALMYVGFQFIIARGNGDKITAAKAHLWYVIIGIAVLFGATLIVEIIKVTLSPFVDTTNLGAKP